MTKRELSGQHKLDLNSDLSSSVTQSSDAQSPVDIKQKAQDCLNLIFILDYSGECCVSGSIYSAIDEFKDELERFQLRKNVLIYIHELICDNGVTVRSSELNLYSVTRAPAKANGSVSFEQIINSLKHIKFQESDYEYIIFCFAAEQLFSGFDAQCLDSFQQIDYLKNAIRIAVPMEKFELTAPQRFASNDDKFLLSESRPERLKQGLELHKLRNQRLPDAASDGMVESKPKDDNTGELYRKIQKLEDDLNSKKARINSLLYSCKQLTSNNNVLSSQIAELKKTNTALSSENAKLTKANTALSDENDALTKANTSLSDENDALTKANAALSLENDALTKTNKALISENVKLTKQNTALTSKNESLATDNAALKSKIEELTKKFELQKAECDTLAHLLSEKEAELDASKNLRTRYQCEREKMTQLLSDKASLQKLSQESSAKVAAELSRDFTHKDILDISQNFKKLNERLSKLLFPILFRL